MSIVCYIRPWNERQFSVLANLVFPEQKVLYLSEHVKCDRSGFAKKYCEYAYKGKQTTIFDILSSDERDDIISRCRLLRALPKLVANKQLDWAGSILLDILGASQPSHVLSLTVDSFIIDLLRVISLKRNIAFIGLIPSFVNGYFRVTARGENWLTNSLTGPSEGELKKVLDVDYQPKFNSPSVSKPRRMVIRRWTVNWLRYSVFSVIRLLPDCRFNYHYWSSVVVAKQNLNIFPRLNFGALDWEDRLSSTHKPRIFIPLQMFPECTVDYWCPDTNVIDYYRCLAEIIEKLSSKFSLVVKEHPSVLGSRPGGFYSRLLNIRELIVIPTYCNSNRILQHMDAVLVWTGTVGLQAALKGIPVLTLGDPYYSIGRAFKKIGMETPLTEIEEYVSRTPAPAEVLENEAEIYSHLKSILLAGNFKNNGTWSESNEGDMNDISRMASSLAAALES